MKKTILIALACLLLGAAFASAQWGAGAYDGRAVNIATDAVDSSKVKANSISGGDFVNPLRYPGNMGITGTLGVGRGELPNAKTVMSVYPAVGGQDSLQVWRRSNGSPVAWIDSTGAFRTLSINGPGYSGGIDNVGSVRGRRFRSDTNGTADLPVIWSANGTQNTGPFWLDNGTGDGRSSRWAIAAKGAQVAVFDSTGITGRINIPAAIPTVFGTGAMYTHGDTLFVYNGSAWKFTALKSYE